MKNYTLREMRENKGFTLVETGSLINVHASLVGQWERGVTSIAKKHIKNLAKIYNVDEINIIKAAQSTIRTKQKQKRKHKKNLKIQKQAKAKNIEGDLNQSLMLDIVERLNNFDKGKEEVKGYIKALHVELKQDRKNRINTTVALIFGFICTILLIKGGMI